MRVLTQNILSYLDSIAKNAIDSMMTPGIQMLVSRKGKIVYNKKLWLSHL